MISGGTITFVQLLEEVDSVEIPIIQRDYAQGRESVAEIRTQFVSAIYDTLAIDPESHSKPLDLDFVYGSLKGDVEVKFWPLDGQQRLTTLFLLHWYLACQDHESAAFQQLVMSEGKSRFTYETRRSSAEFFTALASHSTDLSTLPPLDVASTSLSQSIRDCAWFFLSWDMDPTIQSALSMLDSIDSKFRGQQALYHRITQRKNPYITFQFLNLEDFGLSDELYIKMNARGKPLTAFENFKARFEQYAAEVCADDYKELYGRELPLHEYLARKIDTDWSDLFWQFCEADTEKFDDQVVQFFRSMVTMLLPLGKTREHRFQIRDQLEAIRKSNFNPSFYQYTKLECLDRCLVLNLVELMDLVCGPGETFRVHLEDASYFDEKYTFAHALQRLETGGKNPQGLTYQRAMMFFGWCVFLIKFRDYISPEALFDWMRVVHNLTENTRVERPIEVTEALLSLQDISANSDQILDFLANLDEEDKISFFYTPQVREEQIKAQLIRRSSEWRDVIIRAELHGYFKGQIEFLLDFSGVLAHFIETGSCGWSVAQDQAYFTRFEDFLLRAEAVFDKDGLKSIRDNLFERALLTRGDYLLYGRSNYSFLDNEDRDTSWKRLLRGSERTHDPHQVSAKRKLLGELLAMIDLDDVEASLRSIIGSSETIDDWRFPFIACPELIDYCEKRCIRRDSNDSIYLLKKIQMNGAHLELWSYYIFLDYLSKLGDIGPFQFSNAQESYGNLEEPCVRLYGMEIGDTIVNLDITYKKGKYVITLDAPSLIYELEGFMEFELDSNDHLKTGIAKELFRTQFPLVLDRLADLATNVKEKDKLEQSSSPSREWS